MPIDIREFLKLADQDKYTQNRSTRQGKNGHAPDGEDSQTAGKWKSLFTEHPESGGTYGGRNNAVVALTGFFRAKSFPYEGGRFFALKWNQEYCNPPLPEDEVLDVVSRAWWRWQEGGMHDEQPEDFAEGTQKKKTRTERRLLTIDDLLDLEENGGGVEWLVPNVFVRGGIHFVSAPAAGAKSWLMLDLSRCIAAGAPWLGTYDVPQGAVLYVDEEMGDARTGKRVRQLGFGRGLPFYYLGKQGIRINDPADLKFIVDTCTEKGISLVCLDTLTGVRPGLMENEASHVSALRAHFNDITNTGATLLVAHHDRKAGQGESDIAHYRMAGSRDFGAMADMAYGIEKRGSIFHMEVTKNRLLADEDTIKVDFVIEDSEDKKSVTLRVVDAAERSEQYVGAIAERVYKFLADNGEANVRGITAGTKGKGEAIKKALDLLYDADRVTIEQRGQQKVYAAV